LVVINIDVSWWRPIADTSLNSDVAIANNDVANERNCERRERQEWVERCHQKRDPRQR